MNGTIRRKIPSALIYSRLIWGSIILLLAMLQPEHFRMFIIILISVGLLSDILDGIIARRLNISNEKLRRLDSTIDQIFWVLVLISCYIISPSFFIKNIVPISIVLTLEALTYIISFIRFRKEVATHAILSKIWTLTIFATVVEIVATGNSNWIFIFCYWLGIVTRLEIILILFLIRHWVNDVPSIYHAVRIRAGKTINRSKWFNG